MKLITIINAVPALQRLCAERIDIQTAFQIHKRLPELDKYINDKKIPYLGYIPDFDKNVDKIGEFCDEIDA